MKFFHNIKTLEELKKAYRKLALIHHPDRGGNEKDFISLKDEYDVLFKQLNRKGARTNREKQHEEQPEREYEYASQEETNNFKEIIDELINLDIDIEIIGTWIWLTGNTKPHRELLKKLGFQWRNNKKAWSYHEGEWKKRTKGNLTMDDIRNLHNSKKVKKNTKNKVLTDK